MKKTWIIFSLAALLTLPLAGCGTAGDDTPSQMPSPSPSASAPAMTLPDPSQGSEDLAGADGIVGGDSDAANSAAPSAATNSAAPSAAAGRSGAGNTGNGDTAGDMIDGIGDGVKDTLDDIGSAARSMGGKARQAIEG